MKLNFTGLSDPGCIHSNNQDYYHIDPQGRFFIVADGTGAGEASRIATEEIQSYLLSRWDSPELSPSLLERALWAANEAIMQDQHIHTEHALSDMGTTVVAVIFREEPWFVYIGNSRLYRLRNTQLEQLTEDQTWVARAIKMGDITPEEARIHPFRHVLARYLGRDDLNSMDVLPLDVIIGDRLLLCSDGLTEELADEIIAGKLQSTRTLEKAALSLIEAAKEKGGKDNLTVIIVSLEE